MNIVLVSQCSKNALIETRRILDQFAERHGDRTWKTIITQAGLNTLYGLLRRSARKNTAVACHWNRGHNHSELLWIVGDARQFNAQGATPTNTTRRDVLRQADENDWHGLEDIRLIAQMAALFHDFGKANDAFQKKLSSGKPQADAFRHEWVSLRLFEAFVRSCGKDDIAWLTALQDREGLTEWPPVEFKQDDLKTFTAPLKGLPPLAQMIGWLIVSHHRLPEPDMRNGEDINREGLLQRLPELISANWCGARPDSKESEKKACWTFKKNLPWNSQHWRQHASRLAKNIVLQRQHLLKTELAQQWVKSPYALHIARMGLMLGDHFYSSQISQPRYGDPVKGKEKPLYANTRNTPEGRVLNQRLDEHLIGVEVNTGRILRTLPLLDGQLPRIARHKGFRERSKGAFRWQNQAFDLAEAWAERSEKHGFFGVNMASTGCGKTLANGRIAYGLAHAQKGARFTVAMGLRTLTRQTGAAYGERLGLNETDLAVLVGGSAQQALIEALASRDAFGNESSVDLLPEHNYVHYEGCLVDGPLKTWLGKNSQALRLLDAPVLTCTIDHLMPATESTRGGHQIAPMLRLMTSDLVLDEVDDFSQEDLPAIARLVHWAGLLGSRVLLSSATLPPALVQGLFLAYQQGRQAFQAHREQGQSSAVVCAWFDEYGSEADFYDEGAAFLARHTQFVSRRIAKLKAIEPRRRAKVVPFEPDLAAAPTPLQKESICYEQWASHCLDYALQLHQQHHTTQPNTGKKVSFGLIRMANIDPLCRVAQWLFTHGAPDGVHVHLCVYHSRHPLLVRTELEHTLDRVLQRHRPEAVFEHPSIQQALTTTPAQDHLFIVLATAVAEVGRDHDYDWAIVEPSSLRSIIQLAGRVKRHRTETCPTTSPNVWLMSHNVKAAQGQRLAFVRPGFESASFPMASHDLDHVLVPEQWQPLTAAPRIAERDTLDPQHNLADLEHATLKDLMLNQAAGGAQKQIPVTYWWKTLAHQSGFLQRKTPFRHDPEGRAAHTLQPNANGGLDLVRLEKEGQFTLQNSRWMPLSLTLGKNISNWATPDYESALETLSEDKNLPIEHCANRYGLFDLPQRENVTWLYHGHLGFFRK